MGIDIDLRSNVVDVRGVHRTYDRDTTPVRALRGMDLSVDVGDWVAVMGPSGCGKSTLLSVVSGLEAPEEGTVTVAGVDVHGSDDGDRAALRRDHIGIVFQFFNLIDDMTAIENVAVAAAIAGATAAEAKRTATDLVDLLGLAGRERDLPSRLSGGQRQRLAIARALVNDPTVLLADEPTGALDSVAAGEILDLFDRLHERGQTIIMVTHEPEVAGRAQRVVEMKDGRAAGEVSGATVAGRHRVAATS